MEDLSVSILLYVILPFKTTRITTTPPSLSNASLQIKFKQENHQKSLRTLKQLLSLVLMCLSRQHCISSFIFKIKKLQKDWSFFFPSIFTTFSFMFLSGLNFSPMLVTNSCSHLSIPVPEFPIVHHFFPEMFPFLGYQYPSLCFFVLYIYIHIFQTQLLRKGENTRETFHLLSPNS